MSSQIANLDSPSIINRSGIIVRGCLDDVSVESHAINHVCIDDAGHRDGGYGTTRADRNRSAVASDVTGCDAATLIVDRAEILRRLLNATERDVGAKRSFLVMDARHRNRGSTAGRADANRSPIARNRARHDLCIKPVGVENIAVVQRALEYGFADTNADRIDLRSIDPANGQGGDGAGSRDRQGRTIATNAPAKMIDIAIVADICKVGRRLIDVIDRQVNRLGGSAREASQQSRSSNACEKREGSHV